MQVFVNTPDEYIDTLPADRKEIIENIRKIILENLPNGFEEVISYGMLGYVVPHKLYPAGYHCDPKLPLPFIGLASQKNYISFYHMGLYANAALMEWFISEYKQFGKKIDIGKSCVRFKKPEDIPFKLIGLLCSKVTANQWINQYEAAYIKNKIA